MNIQAIETYYKGYRFRSRLEARWAVFFDAVGIEWQYEVEGYQLENRRYLPDFWLPKSETFVEIKPTKETAEEVRPLIKELVSKTGKHGLIIGGSPNEHERHVLIDVGLFGWDTRRSYAHTSFWRRCILCTGIHARSDCKCTPTVQFYGRPSSVGDTAGRVVHALGEAQRARFEHGENGKPKPYQRKLPAVKVYYAGSVLVDKKVFTDDGEEWNRPEVVQWRRDLFGRQELVANGKITYQRFHYAGPSILEDHGVKQPGLPENCLREVRNSDVVFAWIDTTETIGTLVEIGAAFARGTPVFIAFPTDDLASHFYFARDLASVSLVCPDVVDAWAYFRNWCDQSSQFCG